LGPEGIKRLSGGATWNFRKGKGLPYSGIQYITLITNFPLLSSIFEMKVGMGNIIYSIVLKGS
jgi:hypothetical protein